ncbi:MBL fold metallo-hydrolase [Ethanoligenens sp.]|uniref:MBL fold metallo-hydrolase n=1 Tax=Ethanoligenens sp. TaxID=2099655 RepID=UPI0039EB21F0
MQEKTRIRFWGGLNTIGGTIVSLEHGGFRIVFDFGIIENQTSGILRYGIHTKPDQSVRDFLKLKRLKPIDGLYRAEDIAELPLCPAESNGKTAVCITHLHIDHMGALGLLSPLVPVFLSKPSRVLYEALHFVEDGADWNPQIQAVDAMQSIVWGPFIVTFLEVDHDVPGACALHIAAPDVRLLYTGDVRLHGRHPEKTLRMAETARTLGVDVALVEGTSLRGREEDPLEIKADSGLLSDTVTEDDVRERMAALIAKTNGLVVLNLYPRNIERIDAAMDAAMRNGRTLVLDPKTAFVAKQMGCMQHFRVLAGGHQDVPEGFSQDAWHWINTDEINHAPHLFVLQNTYQNSLDLLHLDLQDGLYIHTGGTPLGIYDPRYPSFRDFVHFLGIDIVSIYCGGHAFPGNLKYLAERLSATVTVPLHSLHPERLAIELNGSFLPRYGIRYLFENGRLLAE